MENTITQRFLELYNSTGLKSVRLWATNLGIPYTTLSEIMRGAEPRYTTIKCIIDGNPLVSAEWLLRGQGEMIRNNRDKNTDELNPLSGIVPEGNINLDITMDAKEVVIQAMAEKIQRLESENAELRRKLGTEERAGA